MDLVFWRQLTSRSRVRHYRLHAIFIVLAGILILSSIKSAAPTAAAESTLDPHFFGESIFSTSVAVGDFNNDGALDIVTGNYQQPGTIYLNDSNGNFTASQVLGLPNTSVGRVAVGDLNGDDALDVVVCYIAINGTNPQSSEVFLNDGTGHFLAARSFGSPINVNTVALGDLNDDGALDIVIGASAQPSIIFFNDGTGAFPTSRPYSTFGTVGSVALADFNSDGMLDLFVGSAGLAKEVHLNDGTGNFPTVIPLGTPSNITGAVAGDFNGDGAIDIVVGNTGQQSEIYFNDGTGNFVTSNAFGGLSNIISMSAADLNGDGAIDVVIGSPTTSIAGFQQSSIYLNDGSGNFALAQLFGSVFTSGVSTGDMNGDSIIDLVVSNLGQLSAVYFNSMIDNFLLPHSFGDIANTRGIAVGDLNGDGALDIVSGMTDQPSRIYFNDGSGNFPIGQAFSDLSVTTSVAVGDLNNDGSLDIVLGNSGQPGMVYLNDGSGNFPINYLFGAPMNTQGIALGDFNGDGGLDIVTANSGQPSNIYLNDGSGNFSAAQEINSTALIDAVAVGDVNGDGILDVVLADFASFFATPQPSNVYIGDGSGHFSAAQPFGIASRTSSIALGDMNSDGALDIVATNFSQPLTIYLNDGAGTFTTSHSIGDVSNTGAVALGDLNGDGALDIVTGITGQPSSIYLNDGFGNFSHSHALGDTALINTVVLGDLNNDGALDLVLGIATDPTFNNVPSQVYINRRINTAQLSNNQPTIYAHRPGSTQNANFYSTPEIIDSQIIPITYTLADSESDAVRAISATYSLDGGGSWRTAVPTNTVTTDLVTSSTGITYTFNWDTFASGFFGHSDNVVFRIVAYPSVRPIPNSVPGPYQRPFASTMTFPFRVRGAQVQVIENGTPVGNALVYRRPQGQAGDFVPIASSPGAPAYTTDSQGFLRGRGQIDIGDQLIALRPISTTDALSATYTLYHTNIAPTAAGVTGFTVTTPGVQQISVSAAHPLALFPLDISLEWDARNDQRFMTQLRSDLARTSEFLFNATNGQAALGEVRIFQDKQWWDAVNLRIYASNRMRPNSVVGGVTTELLTDTVSLHAQNPAAPPVVYGPGQLRMGSVWNRFGNASNNLSEDWPRTLAHELGHYLLFLEDNYIGTDDQQQIIPIDTCTGLMSDPYASNGELHPDAGWLPGCAQTLSNRSTGRADWSTVKTFYPALISPTVAITDPSIAGPANLPLTVTHITSYDPITPTAALDVPIFYLTRNGARYQPGLSSRGYLFSNRQANPNLPPDRITLLGRANLDQILARGARVGDRICLYEPEQRLQGCTIAALGVEQISLESTPGWPPDLIVTPVTSTTLALTVTGVPADMQPYGLQAQLFPADEDLPATVPIALTAAGNGVFTGTITIDMPVAEAQIYLKGRAGDGTPREAITSLSLGGNPGYIRTGGGYIRTGGGYIRTGGGYIRTGGGYIRTGGGYIRTGGAPVSSAEGDVLLLGDNLNFQVGQFLALQTTASLPQPPPWATVIGNAYRFTTSPNPPDLSQTSLSFSYLESDVPAGEEDGIAVYFWDDKVPQPHWERLQTTRNTYYNIASIQNQGPGLYALMTSVSVGISAPGWNLIAYPVRATQPVTQALASIDGFYTTVYGYNTTDAADPWKIYDVSAPDWVNDLSALEFGKGYWINATDAITLYLKGGPLPALNREARASATAANIPIPPATYYGAVPGASPQASLTVQAWIGDTLCGQAQTSAHMIDGALRNTFAINVSAADSGAVAGCGTPGRTVRLVALDRTRAVWSIGTAWDNSHAIEIRPATVYLPLAIIPARSNTGLTILNIGVLSSASRVDQSLEMPVMIRNTETADLTRPSRVRSAHGSAQHRS